MSSKQSSKKQLTSFERGQIKKELEDGVEPVILANEYSVSPRTIKRIGKKESTKRKSYDNSNRFKLNEQDKVDIEEAGTTNLSKVNQYIGNKVHNRTISRHYKRISYRTYKALNKTHLNNYNKKKRLSFAHLYGWWSHKQWKRVIFTDETTVQNFSSKEFIRCKKEDRFNIEYYNKKAAKRISVNIWGFINFYESRIFKISHNFDRTEYYELLNDSGVLEYIKYVVPGTTLYFQQDNFRVHKTAENVNLTKLNGFNLFPNWPAYSPDLNPIEIVWAILKKKVSIRIKEVEVKTEDDLFDLCNQCFLEISQKTIQDLILSLPLNLDEVIRLNGEMTRK